MRKKKSIQREYLFVGVFIRERKIIREKRYE